MNNPKHFAPIWGVIHIMALDAKTPAEQTIANKAIYHIITHLPCQQCSKHAIENIKTRVPFDKFLTSKKDEYALFRWSVEFHNTVNRQLGKPIIDFDTAKELWEEVFNCKDCTLHEEPSNKEDDFGIIYKK
jgi:hypothetical protein